MDFSLGDFTSSPLPICRLDITIQESCELSCSETGKPGASVFWASLPGLYFGLPLALGDLPLTVIAVSFDVFLYLCVSSEPPSMMCNGWGNPWGMCYLFWCSTAEGRQGHPPAPVWLAAPCEVKCGAHLSRALACLLCAKHVDMAITPLEQVVGCWKGHFPLVEEGTKPICVSLQHHCALTPLMLCTPCFPAGCKQRELKRIFFPFVSPLSGLSLPVTSLLQTTYLAGQECESQPWPGILPPALASSTAAGAQQSCC